MQELQPLQSKNCVLLVVDIQQRLMPVIDGAAAVVKNSALLIKAAKVLDIPVLATTQYAARIGTLLPEISTELAGVMPLDKLEFNCLANGAIRGALKELAGARDTLLICGVEAHICIYQSVFGAIKHGYRAWVAADAVASRTVANYTNGLARIKEIGATVGSTEMIIYELLAKAGTAGFKALLPLLK